MKFSLNRIFVFLRKFLLTRVTRCDIQCWWTEVKMALAKSTCSTKFRFPSGYYAQLKRGMILLMLLFVLLLTPPGIWSWLRCFRMFWSLPRSWMYAVGLRNSEGPDLSLRYMKRQWYRIGIKKKKMGSVLVLPLPTWVALGKLLNLSELHFLPLQNGNKMADLCTWIKGHMY